VHDGIAHLSGLKKRKERLLSQLDSVNEAIFRDTSQGSPHHLGVCART